MNFQKSIVKVLIGVLMIALLLCGCAKPAGTQQPAAPDDGPAASEPVTLHFTSWRTEDAEAWDNILAEFHSAYPNIEVYFEPIKATEYDAQLKLNLESGQAADLYMSRTFDRGIAIAREGYALPLTAENIPALADVSDSNLASCRMDDGTVFAVPASVSAVGFVYNEAIFEQYDLEEPSTWDEFFQICETLKSNGVRPIAMCYKDNWTNSEHSNQLLPAFIDGDPEDFRQGLISGKTNFLSDEFVNHLDMLNKLKPYCGDDFLGISYTDSQQLFIAEQAAIFMGGTYELSYFTSANPDLRIGYFSTPSAVNPGKAAPLCITVAGGYAVNARSEHVEEALVFLNWLTSEAGGKAYMQYLDTQPAVLPAGTQSSDPLLKEWFADGGENFENTMQYWSFEKLNADNPSAKTLVCEAIQMGWAGEMDAQAEAQYIQDGVASWYAPQQEQSK